MPVPTLRIEEEALGLPRQPVPLRLACLVTGLTCADFRHPLAAIRYGRSRAMSRRDALRQNANHIGCLSRNIPLRCARDSGT
jgi:hypothetical protein